MPDETISMKISAKAAEALRRFDPLAGAVGLVGMTRARLDAARTGASRVFLTAENGAVADACAALRCRPDALDVELTIPTPPPVTEADAARIHIVKEIRRRVEATKVSGDDRGLSGHYNACRRESLESLADWILTQIR
jgi:hypothetical protein